MKKPKEITCPNGCGFYAYEGSEGRDEMNAHLRIDCKRYTPGPWMVGPYILDVRTVSYKDDPQPAKVICSMVHTDGDAETKRANASLIATAPELLEALQRCRDLLLDSVNFNEGDKATTEAVSIADVVIAKAEGK